MQEFSVILCSSSKQIQWWKEVFEVRTFVSFLLKFSKYILSRKWNYWALYQCFGEWVIRDIAINVTYMELNWREVAYV